MALTISFSGSDQYRSFRLICVYASLKMAPCVFIPICIMEVFWI